jgi:hypothetical protein
MVVQASTRLNTVADLQNADGTKMGFCGIDQVFVHAIWSIPPTTA